MGDPPHYSHPQEDGGVKADRGAASGARRRLSILGGILVIAIAIAIALVVMIVVLHLTGTIGPGVH